MYDTLVLHLNKEDIGGYKYENVLRNITQTCEYKGQVAGGCGYWENLRITATEKKVVCRGSIVKFQRGSNAPFLYLEDVKKLIKYIGNCLGIPLEKADVDIVDIAENFEMENPPQLYIQRMQTLASYSSNNWEDTKYFSSRGAVLRFYDKTQELRQKNQHRPERARCSLPGRNLLRYEVRFKRGKIRQMFGRGLKASDLYDKEVFWRFVSEWFYCYESINKLPDTVLNVTFDQIRKQEDLLNWCECALNAHVPVSEFVKQAFKNRVNPQEGDRQYHKRLQDRIREALVHYNDYMTGSDLTLELTRKIEDFLTKKFESSPDAYDKN